MAVERSNPVAPRRTADHSKVGCASHRVCPLRAAAGPASLSILHTNARGRHVEFFFIGQLPPILGPDKVLAKQAITTHEVIGYLLLALIAMHAAAALFHHFIRRDEVLNAMLPSRRR